MPYFLLTKKFDSLAILADFTASLAPSVQSFYIIVNIEIQLCSQVDFGYRYMPTHKDVKTIQEENGEAHYTKVTDQVDVFT